MIDITSQENQQFINQVKRDRSISKFFQEWLESVVSCEVSYIAFLFETKAKAKQMVSDLEENLNAWAEEKDRWEDDMAHVVLHFLTTKCW